MPGISLGDHFSLTEMVIKIASQNRLTEAGILKCPPRLIDINRGGCFNVNTLEKYIKWGGHCKSTDSVNQAQPASPHSPDCLRRTAWPLPSIRSLSRAATRVRRLTAELRIWAVGAASPPSGYNTPTQGSIYQTTTQDVWYYTILPARTYPNLYLVSLRLPSSSRSVDLSPKNLLP